MYSNLEEEWRPIDGFPNYAVSNRGRVMNIKTGKVLKIGVNRCGYEQVGLSMNCKRMIFLIHRLVANAFIPNPNNLPEVNHINEIKTDNNVNNLEWSSASRNNKHSLYKRSCKINQLSLDGQFIKEWNSAHEIERELGFSKGHIIKCCKGRYKKMYGYLWEYADPSQQHKQNRPVVALTKDGEFIAEYKSAAEASRCLGIIKQSIHYTLKGRFKTTNGYKFKYADEQ